jgi:predicted alpha/beta-fold hydrolase
VTLEVTRGGGHVAFVAGGPLRPTFWVEARALAFLRRHLDAAGS